jgi:long-chain fatty acid transport protein
MKKGYSIVLSLLFLSAVSVFLASTSAYATNGMNLEGYGPIATGMGGASMAYDNGVAAVMNNPATLGLMPNGNRLDVALGYLGPNIKAEVPGAEAKSSANAFFMPAIGWAQKSGQYAYGVGVFSQGGMGTEYGADSFLAMGSGDKVRSELGVGRFIIPFVYNVTPDVSVGATVDYVWASLDLKMALPGSAFAGLVTNCSGPACAGLSGFAAAPWTRLDFSGGGDFSGAAKGAGFAGKLGATYKMSPAFAIGATYHSKTNLSDLETTSDGATISAAGFGAVGTGKIKVRDFEWPETYAVGVAWNASNDLLVVFDVKQINWKAVMKDFKLTYEGPLAGAPGNTIDFALPQNWKDQTVFELGVGYKVNPEWTLRAGLNYANNPIPDLYLNYLFPAIEKTHVTIGAGYQVSKASSVDASFTYAPEVKQTGGSGVTSTHSQTNAQLMYSYRF